MMNPKYFTEQEKDALLDGDRVVVGNAIYVLCFKCYRPVKVNKWLVGALHRCVDDAVDEFDCE